MKDRSSSSCFAPLHPYGHDILWRLRALEVGLGARAQKLRASSARRTAGFDRESLIGVVKKGGSLFMPEIQVVAAHYGVMSSALHLP